MSTPVAQDWGRAQSRFRRHLRWATVLPLVTMAAAAGVLVGFVTYVQNVNGRIDLGDVVIGRAHVIERSFVDARSNLRAYIFTGSAEYVDACREAEGRLTRDIDALGEIVTGDPPQAARLASARAGAARWEAYAERELTRRRDAATAREAPLRVLEGDAIGNEFRSRLQELIDAQEALRAREDARADAVNRSVFAAGLILALVVGPALALGTAGHMRRSGQEYREALEAQVRVSLALRESEEKLRRAEDAAKIGAWEWDLLSGEVTMSDHFRELMGVAPGATASYAAFLASLHPGDRDRIDQAVKDALARKARYDVQMRVIAPDGSVRWVASRGEGTYRGDGRPVRMSGMAQDITVQKLAEEALRDADRRKDEFLGVLSHELRNPLAPVRNAIYVLDRAPAGSEQAARARTIIARQVDHLARLVEDLLDVKRISSGKLRLHDVPMNLTEQVRETVEDVRPLFVNRSVSLGLEVPPRDVWVNGDRTRLAQVLSNLLHNAAKFTDAGGHVSVTVESADGEVRIRVRDDGLGVEPELLDEIFQPFLQTERTLHRSKGGLGLGLPLVRGITELHGGTVVARSEGIGKGAEFVVTLPTTEPAAAAFGEVAPQEHGVKRRVLVIDDNADAAGSLQDMLEMIGGHEVHVARDGEAGVAAARRVVPDVVLCDLGLPGIDGYEVARRIRGSETASEARLIAVSGFAAPEDVDRAIRAGFDYHVPKPSDVDRTLRLVAGAPAAARAVPAEIATGNHEVDAQHAAILERATQLRASADAVWETVRWLGQYTASHFRYEETLMEDVDYPELGVHRRLHAQFLHDLQAVRDDLEQGGATPENVGRLLGVLDIWVAGHVMGADRRLAEFIRAPA